mmetsp:Transcript_28530/g.29678  ORF Transcript_28530/g.29678 Transcript_28530/m.29678 type:complete len:271 (+) Transcript_28530:800-1612(+)
MDQALKLTKVVYSKKYTHNLLVYYDFYNLKYWDPITNKMLVYNAINPTQTFPIEDQDLLSNSTYNSSLYNEKKVNLHVLDSYPHVDSDSLSKMYATEVFKYEKAKEMMNGKRDLYYEKMNALSAAGGITSSTLNSALPVGTVYATFENVNPPYHLSGMTWAIITEEYAVMTASQSNVGSFQNSLIDANKLVGGTAKDHTLTIDEMPAHNHEQGAGEEFPLNGYDRSTDYRNESTTAEGKIPYTFETGGDQAHSHTLNVKTIKIILWKRTA